MAKFEKSKKLPKRKVTHISIERGANGFSVDHRKEHPPMHMMGGPGEPQPKPAFFGDHAAMLSHVGDLAKQMGGDEADAPEGAPAGA